MDAAAGIAAKGSTVYLLSCRYAADYDFGTTTAEAIPYPVHQRLIARIYAQLSAHGHRVHVTVFASPLAYELWLDGRTPMSTDKHGSPKYEYI